MTLPEKITYIHDTSENVDEILANKINQLIDYLKEKEDDKIPGEMAESMGIPKKIDVEELLKEYALINDSNYIYFQSNRGRSQEIINQIIIEALK